MPKKTKKSKNKFNIETVEQIINVPSCKSCNVKFSLVTMSQIDDSCTVKMPPLINGVNCSFNEEQTLQLIINQHLIKIMFN